MSNLQNDVLSFLYKWVNENKIPQIKKGMAEDLIQLVADINAKEESEKASARFAAMGEFNETSSK